MLIAEHAISFIAGVLVGFWIASFYRIVKRNGTNSKTKSKAPE